MQSNSGQGRVCMYCVASLRVDRVPIYRAKPSGCDNAPIEDTRERERERERDAYLLVKSSVNADVPREHSVSAEFLSKTEQLYEKHCLKSLQ